MGEIVIPKVQLIPVEALKVDGLNPNVMSFEQEQALKENILKYGFLTPVITNEEFLVADGEHRLQAAKELGMTEVPCLVLPIKEVDRKILRQVMNKLKGEHDKALDLEEFKYLFRNNAMEDLQKLLGSDDQHLVQFLASEKGEVFEEDESHTMEDYNNPVFKVEIGDVYACGEHRVMCGDSCNKAHVDALMKGNKAVLMVTDPPYGVEYNPQWRVDAARAGFIHGANGTATGKVMNDARIDWSEAYEKFNADVAYVWHAGKYAGEVKDSLTKLGYDIVSQIIWVKPHFVLSRGDYHWRHEPCWYAVKKGSPHNWQGSREEDTVWEIASVGSFFGKSSDEIDARTPHGTQKPVECMRKPILNNSREGEVVVDPFGGSGSTLIAAEQLKRRCFVMELDPAYVSIILQRWAKLTGLTPVKEEKVAPKEESPTVDEVNSGSVGGQ